MRIGVVEQNPNPDRNQTAPDRLRDEVETEREAARRLEEIYQYLNDQYARREVVARTVTPLGQHLDWIPIESQYPDRKVPNPPDEDRPVEAHTGPYPAKPVQFELQREGAELGPPGTVPVVRLQTERIRPTGNLQDWLSKGRKARSSPTPEDGRGAILASDPIHKYAHSRQNVICYGTEGVINVWWPYVQWSDEGSIGQMWVSRGTSVQQQTVEVGHQVSYEIYGDWEPHLFTFFTTNGYSAYGDNLGGYNDYVRGWRQQARAVHPGAISRPVSESGGVQYELSIRVQLFENDAWWVRVNGIWIGSYPLTLFNSTGLLDHSDSADWGGEIWDSREHGTTETDMGSGQFPYAGWQHCAYMRNLLYLSTLDGTLERFRGYPDPTYPLCYGIAADHESTGPFGSHFWWGGSGRNRQCP
jgi:hypothetical protein